MNWLREVFWLMNAFVAFTMVIPIVVGGAIMVVVAWDIPRGVRRMAVLSSIVVLQAVIPCLFSFPYGIRIMASELSQVLLPVTVTYPHLNMASLLFFWIPVITELIYSTRCPSPRPWKAALLGFIAVLIGFIFLLVVGIAVGAQTD